MESNSPSSNNAFDAARSNSIARALSDGFANRFYEILLATIFIGAVVYILKTLDILHYLRKSPPAKKDKPNKSEEKTTNNKNIVPKTNQKALNTRTKGIKDSKDIIIYNKNREIEIYKICEKFNCSLEDLFLISKEDYNDLFNHVVNTYDYSDHIIESFNNYSTIDSNGDVIFIGEAGLAAYSHAIIASEYSEGKDHPLAGNHIDNLIYIPCDHEFFNDVKDMGGPSPRVKNAYSISSKQFTKFIQKKAVEKCGEDANYAWFFPGKFQDFAERTYSRGDDYVADFIYEEIGKFGDRTYMAFPKGFREIFDWEEIEGGTKLDIEIDEVFEKVNCGYHKFVKVPADNYKKFIDFINASNVEFKDIVLKSLEENAIEGSDGQIFFAGIKGLSAYAKALVSYKLLNHPLKGSHPESLVYIDFDSPAIEELKDIEEFVDLSHGLVISKSKYQDYIESIARDHYDENAEYSVFDKKEFRKFKKELIKRGIDTNDKDYHFICNIDSKIYVAFPEGSKEKYDWIEIHSVQKKKK